MWWNRCDGTLVEDVPPYRQIMPYLMRGRNESAAYFDTVVDVTRTEAFLADHNRLHPEHRATVFHVVLWGLAKVLDESPRLNRFVAGGRLYQRDGIWISFAAKKALADGAPLEVVKRRFDPAEPFPDLVADIQARVAGARSDASTPTDRELATLLHLPGVGLRALLAVERAADALGLLPRFFVEGDPMFTSVFVANLGSLGMDAAFHHLYEYGNAGVFCTVGRIVEEPVVREGVVTPARVVHLRFTYDERIDDGMYAGAAVRRLQHLVEDPAAGGCTVATLAPVAEPRAS